MNNIFTVPVSSMDLAALLCSLGFEMTYFEIIHHIKMEEKDKRHKTAVFKFSDTSESGLTLKKVRDDYIFPQKGQPARNVCEFAKIAAHNYQILKSVILENRPLQIIQGENYCILKNMNGQNVEGEKTNYFSSDLSVIAIAAALGFNITHYTMEDGKLIVYFDEDLLYVENEFKTDKDDNSYGYLAVLVNTFKNRKILMEETFAKHTLHLSNGFRQVIVGKEMGDNLKKKVMDFLN